MSLVFQDDDFASVLLQMFRQAELHIEEFVEQFVVHTAVILVMAVLHV